VFRSRRSKKMRDKQQLRPRATLTYRTFQNMFVLPYGGYGMYRTTTCTTTCTSTIPPAMLTITGRHRRIRTGGPTVISI
jgi:hypothetical protein